MVPSLERIDVYPYLFSKEFPTTPNTLQDMIALSPIINCCDIIKQTVEVCLAYTFYS